MSLPSILAPRASPTRFPKATFPSAAPRIFKELPAHLKLGPALLVGWSLAAFDLLAYAEQFGGASIRA
jgi:hypothetical protein